ncbi:MAG: winged helix-turn-helix transcriptional regulator [Clostridiales bacterium]|nr:winged helix-turn-helix transcriptional regulator [Clostridiales bacterium]
MTSKLDYVAVYKALGDETRLKIIEILSCGELCACDILESFAITQPTLSYHMKILTECGLVISRKEGSWIRYSNNEEVIAEVRHFWEYLTDKKEDCICNKKEENLLCK